MRLNPFLTNRVVLVVLIGLLTAALPGLAQTAAASINGVVHDPQGAVIQGAKITLVNNDQGRGSARELTSGGEGAFVFTPLLPGTYSLTVEQPGFKKFTQSNIVVNVADRIGLSAIALEVGSTGESVTVEAAAVQLETVTAERSGVVTGRQMVDIAINGRNFTSLLRTIPGVTADTASSSGTATINGQRGDQNNFTVDGQNVTDIGVNQQFAYRINVDAIAEFKVSTNSQGAEFGRNSGAQVQVVTKSGTKDFHGSGWWFKRGEFMNGNTFTNNATPVRQADGTIAPTFPAYRFMTAGFTVGGPIYIPGKFNRNKDKLFGFMSNEWQRSFQPNQLRQITIPTNLERGGDFSATRDGAGVPVLIYDPLTARSANAPLGLQFPGNRIPVARFNEFGPSVLNWLPQPNTAGQAAYNYQSQVANADPAYDQIYRVDYNMTDKWRFFARHLNSKQTQTRPYGRADTGNVLGLSPFTAPTYGWSLTANMATLISPTLTNEFQFGYTVNGIPGNAPPAGSPYYRSVSNVKIPLLYPEADPSGLIPNFDFGGIPSGSNGNTAMTSFAGSPYANRNPVWNYIDNVTKLVGVHTVKVGFYYEYAVKTENAFKPYNSTISFGRDANNPGDTNWAFANALLGNYASYQQINKDPLPSYPYHNIEFYGQDSWKVSKKLTVNYGLRVSFIEPFHDVDNLMSNFEYAKYDPSKSVRFYLPAIVGGTRQALNPVSGQTLPSVYIGAILPGVGDINNGLVRSGQGDTPTGLIQHRGAHYAPRLGLAYQIDSKTVFRMGGGVFYERIATFGVGITSNYTTNPPLLRTAQLKYGSLSSIASSSAVFFPTAVNRLSSDGHVPTVYNYNAGLQRELPRSLFLDVSFVGSQSRHLWLAQPFNNVGFGSAWLPQTQDPTTTARLDGTTNLPVDLYRPYAGYTTGSDFTFGASANYNALQVALNRRKGPLLFGMAYTFSKALGVIQGHITNARVANYGPLSLDRTQSLTFNYIYDIPSLARKGLVPVNVATKAVLAGWQFSGLTSISSGAPVNVTYSISGVGAAQLNRQITGSEDVAPRVVMTCNPNLSSGDKTIDAFINTSCFAPAQKGSTQMDSGLNRIVGPGLQNWDMNLFKNVSFGEKRPSIQLRLEAFNAFNHTEWGSVNTVAQFNAAGKIANLPAQLGGTGGRFGFGALSAVRTNSQRIVQAAVKLSF